MDQPTAEKALKDMEVLAGEWALEAVPPGGEPWPGEARTSFEWLEGNQLLLGRTAIELPEAPDSICVYGCDAANGTYYQLYSDDRGVCRAGRNGLRGGLRRRGDDPAEHQRCGDADPPGESGPGPSGALPHLRRRHADPRPDR